MHQQHGAVSRGKCSSFSHNALTLSYDPRATHDRLLPRFHAEEPIFSGIKISEVILCRLVIKPNNSSFIDWIKEGVLLIQN